MIFYLRYAAHALEDMSLWIHLGMDYTKDWVDADSYSSPQCEQSFIAHICHKSNGNFV